MRFSLTRLSIEPSPARDTTGRVAGRTASSGSAGPTPAVSPDIPARSAGSAASPSAHCVPGGARPVLPPSDPASETWRCFARAGNTVTSPADTAPGPRAVLSSQRAGAPADRARPGPGFGSADMPSGSANAALHTRDGHPATGAGPGGGGSRGSRSLRGPPPPASSPDAGAVPGNAVAPRPTSAPGPPARRSRTG